MTRRQDRKLDIRRRIAGPQDAYDRCRVVGCTQPTTAIKKKGLNRLYCRRHVDHYRRHGSYFKGSCSSAELKPYRRRAVELLTANRQDARIVEAINGIKAQYRRAGQRIEPFRLAGKPPAERANALWASLRERAVDPVEVLVCWLAVVMKIVDDPQRDGHDEYRDVQVAKLIHRMAGGTHKRWERELPDGSIGVTVLHKHPNSRGRVLRLIGKQVATVCEGLAAVL